MPKLVIRAQPQIVRKRTIVKTIPTQIVIKPATAKIAPLKAVKILAAQSDAANRAKKPAKPKGPSAVNQPRNPAQRQRRRKKEVIYQTRDASPESVAKIHQIRHLGRNRILVIIGNGPSILNMPLEQLKSQPNIDVLSINQPDQRVWPSRFWSFFDRSQINRHKAIWDTYDGIIFNSTAIREQKQTSMQFKNLGASGWSYDLAKGIYIGRSSVYCSMQIALWMDYRQTYIVGCDMNPDGINGKLHFYGDNPDVEPSTRAKRFEKEAEVYLKCTNILSEADIRRFTFCSAGINPWPFMAKFNTLNPDVAIATILDAARHL